MYKYFFQLDFRCKIKYLSIFIWFIYLFIHIDINYTINEIRNLDY